MAAPEALYGNPSYKSDIWSCGIILYIILSGQIHIYGSSLRRLRQKMQSCTYILIKISQILIIKNLNLYRNKQKV